MVDKFLRAPGDPLRATGPLKALKNLDPCRAIGEPLRIFILGPNFVFFGRYKKKKKKKKTVGDGLRPSLSSFLTCLYSSGFVGLEIGPFEVWTILKKKRWKLDIVILDLGCGLRFGVVSRGAGVPVRSR